MLESNKNTFAPAAYRMQLNARMRPHVRGGRAGPMWRARWLAFALALSLRVHRAEPFNWKQVKPMYLVSMEPSPSDVHAMPADSHGKDPVILNLETPPMDVEMLPGGAEAMNRIFGGKVANRHCFPYQVGLLLQRPKGLYWCGGSLISDKYVLTAAHCVDMAERALVFLGAHEIKNAKEVGQVRIMVPRKNFVIFPTWNPRRLKDDIALVRLPRAINFNDRIQPIPLPKRSYEYRSFNNKLAITSGWGRYATGAHAISGVLRFVNLKIIDGKTCKRNFPLSYRATNICTSGQSKKSTCNGDSGGPLVLRRKHSKKRVLIGITSFGSIFGCDRGYPAAFTKVASYLDWISDETGIEPHQQFTNAAFLAGYLQDYDSKTRRGEREGAAEAAYEHEYEDIIAPPCDALATDATASRFQKHTDDDIVKSITVYLGATEPSQTHRGREQHHHPLWLEQQDPKERHRSTSTSNTNKIHAATASSYSNYIGDYVIASGWGRIRDSTAGVTNTLQWARMTVISNSLCAATYGTSSVTSTNISSRLMLCLLAMVTLAAKTNWSLPRCKSVCLVRCAVGCEFGHPTAFTRATSYLDWIKSHTGISH